MIVDARDGFPVTIDKQHYHNEYYDAIQVAVVKYIDKAGSATVSLIKPSIEYYGEPSLASTITYTGNEDIVVSSEVEITVEDAQIMTARTIEEHKGVLYLADIKYWDLAVEDVHEVAAETVIKPLSVSLDPLNNGSASGGYYNEILCQRYRGYFRDEVYRFGRTYVNKFGHWSRPVPFDFSRNELLYDSQQHATTWQLNWARGPIVTGKQPR